MREKLYGDLEFELKSSKRDLCRPLSGIFELTYACGFECVHCYCKGSERPEEEITLAQIKAILLQLESSGCIRIAFSGGDPLMRKDFPDLYMFARERGFLIDIFSNGYNLPGEVMAIFKKYPPLSIEITLNGISKKTFESVTQRKDSFDIVLDNINKLKNNNLPLVIKSNCLSLNKHEIIAIKSFSEELFGAGSRRFRFDSLILPRLNGDRSPCAYRLSGQEIKDIFDADKEVMAEYADSLACNFGISRDKKFIYQCSTWRAQFFINPFGKIKFCQFSDEFSVDLKKYSLKDYLSQISEKILNEEFKTNVKCKNCRLRSFCYYCPARAYLETGSKERPVEYFCELAKFREQESQELINS